MGTSIVEEIAIKRESYLHRIEMVDKTVKNAGGEISEYLFKSVAEGKSYPELVSDGIPCGRDYFYERYRRYFYLLDKVRD